MTTRARIGAHLLSLALVLGALVVLQGRAEASCAQPPQLSDNAFNGTVVSVDEDGRVANVLTDYGKNVVVVGSADPDGSSRTSADRYFAKGGRYEFHPVNASSPFKDNACTATRQLSGPEPATRGAAGDRLPGWLPVDEDAGILGYAAVGGFFVALLALAAAAGAIRNRRRLHT